MDFVCIYYKCKLCENAGSLFNAHDGSFDGDIGDCNPNF